MGEHRRLGRLPRSTGRVLRRNQLPAWLPRGASTPSPPPVHPPCIRAEEERAGEGRGERGREGGRGGGRQGEREAGREGVEGGREGWGEGEREGGTEGEITKIANGMARFQGLQRQKKERRFRG